MGHDGRNIAYTLWRVVANPQRYEKERKKAGPENKLFANSRVRAGPDLLKTCCFKDRPVREIFVEKPGEIVQKKLGCVREDITFA
jgi:hypothetical protein